MAALYHIAARRDYGVLYSSFDRRGFRRGDTCDRPILADYEISPYPAQRMGRFKYHIFMCVNERAPDDPKGSCTAKGSKALQELFKSEVKRRGLSGLVRANKAGCLDACEHGPTVVIYPDDVWYRVRTEADVLEVMDRHIERGEIVPHLLIPFSKTQPV